MYFQQPILTSGPLKVGQQNISKTDTLPAGSFCGFKIIRFIADNPGVWNMHCHISSHMVYYIYSFVLILLAHGNASIFLGTS